MEKQDLPFISPNLHSGGISLRPVHSDDYRILFDWHTDISNLHLWWAERRMMTFDDFVDDFRRRLGRTIQNIFIIQSARGENTSSVGMVYNYNTNTIDQYTYLCVFLTPQHIGCGIGSLAGVLFADYLFSYFNFRKIYAEVFAYNNLSLRAAKHNGFREEGILREHRWFGDRYWDLHILSLYRSGFEEVKQKLQGNYALRRIDEGGYMGQTIATTVCTPQSCK